MLCKRGFPHITLKKILISVNTNILSERLNCYFSMPRDSLSRGNRSRACPRSSSTRRAPWKRARLGRSRAHFGGDTLALLNMLLVRSYNCFILSAWPEGDHLPARADALRQEEEKGAKMRWRVRATLNRHTAFRGERVVVLALPEVLPGRPRLFNRPPLINATPPCNFAKLRERPSCGTFGLSSGGNRQ